MNQAAETLPRSILPLSFPKLQNNKGFFRPFSLWAFICLILLALMALLGLKRSIAISSVLIFLCLILWNHKYRIPALIISASLSAEVIGINIGNFAIAHIVTFVLLCLYFIDGLWVSGVRFYFSKLFIPIGLLNILNMISYGKAINFQSWFYLVIDFLNCSIICFIVSNSIHKYDDVARTLKTIIGIGILVALIGITQFIIGGLWRVYSIIGLYQWNTLAGYLMLIIPLCLSGYASFKNHGIKLYFLISSIILILCLFMTQSRGGVAALMGVFIIIIILSYRNDFRKIVKILLTFLAISLSFWILSLIIFPLFIKMVRLRTQTIGMSDMAMWSRAQLFYSAWNMFKTHPITGIGLGNFFYSYTQYGAVAEFPNLWRSAHNIYLQVLGEQGILGFILLFGIIGTLIKNLLTYLKETTESSQSWFYLGLMGSIIGLLIHGFVDSILHFRPFSFMLWILIGITVALEKIRSQRKVILRI